MSAELHARAKAVFLALCDLPESERKGALEERYPGDSELRREVEALLAHHEEDAKTAEVVAGDWPETLAAKGEEVSSSASPPSIPGYRLLQRLGEGGMGVVYEADQEGPVRRRVALKLLKLGMDTTEVVARFESERQALALMDHPNIATVLEAGTSEEGRPFFAMEYVRGVAITDYCDTQRLDLAHRLELFVQVCSGVQHAHQKGVIHRDLKPSNVLVALQDGRPVPKIIDFGVAKAIGRPLTESTLFTQLGQWIGTPEYMSPEQAEMSGLDIDTRTDVYSLGVLLYELLVGSRPFDRSDESGEPASLDELRRRIREDEPTRPSARARLEASATAIARARNSEAQTLARRLRGDLDWIVLRALEKDRTRRYESPSALAADIERHLHHQPVVAGPPSTLYRLRKFGRRHRVGVAAGLVIVVALLLGIVGTTVGLSRAQREAESARQVSEFLVRLFESLDPGAGSAEHAATAEEILSRGVARIDSELAEQPVVQAQLWNTVGGVYASLLQFDRARPLLERALETRRRHLGPRDPAVADSLSLLGRLRQRSGEWNAAQALYEEALEIRERAYGRDHLEASWSLADLGLLHLRMGDRAAAARELERARTIREKHLDPNHLGIASIRFLQGDLWLQAGEYERARSTLEQVLAVREAALGTDHPSTAWVLNTLGRLHFVTGELDTAERQLRRALDILESTFGPQHTAVAYPLYNLADLYRVLARYEESGALYERVLEIRRRAYGTEHGEVAWSLLGKGRWLAQAGQTEAARETLEQALEIARRTTPPAHPELAWGLNTLGYVNKLLGRSGEAREQIAAALARLEETLGAEHPDLAFPLMNLGSLLRDLGELEEARALIERGFELRRRGNRPDGQADDLHTLARLRHREGRLAEAEDLYRQAIDLTAEVLGPRHPWVVRALRDYARLLRELQRPEEAEGLEARARSIER